jgi:hypothetical protein
MEPAEKSQKGSIYIQVDKRSGKMLKKKYAH